MYLPMRIILPPPRNVALVGPEVHRGEETPWGCLLELIVARVGVELCSAAEVVHPRGVAAVCETAARFLEEDLRDGAERLEAKAVLAFVFTACIPRASTRVYKAAAARGL